MSVEWLIATLGLIGILAVAVVVAGFVPVVRTFSPVVAGAGVRRTAR